MELKPNDVQEILRIFVDSELEELRLDLGDTHLHVSKGGATFSADAPAAVRATAAGSSAAPPAAAPAVSGAAGADPSPATPATADEGQAAGPASETASDAPNAATATEGLLELRSPLLGVFYRRPSPEEPPFVDVGSEVEADDPVCVIDVMKMFTRVPAGTTGRIAEICVEDGNLVEHGQVLMRIDPR